MSCCHRTLLAAAHPTSDCVWQSWECAHRVTHHTMHAVASHFTPQWQICQPSPKPSPRIEPTGGTCRHTQSVLLNYGRGAGAPPCGCHGNAHTVATRSNNGRSDSHRRGSSHLVAPTTNAQHVCLARAHEVGALGCRSRSLCWSISPRSYCSGPLRKIPPGTAAALC